MADSPPTPDIGNHSGVGRGPGSTTTTPSYPGTPRWVKVSAIVVLVLALLLVIVMFAGGGNHGPGRHMPSGGAGGYRSPIAHVVHQR